MDTVRRYSMLIDGTGSTPTTGSRSAAPPPRSLSPSWPRAAASTPTGRSWRPKAAHEEGRWRRTPPEERASVLGAIADRLSEQVDDLAVLEALENGAPVLVHVDLSARLDRRAYPLLLSTPPD